jgi:tRNA dimethylallyltransferase
MKNKIIVILGPTASGKTEWGISFAKKFNGEIVCADSRTVYKYLNIGTAKPKGRKCGIEEEKELGCRNVKGIKHYLLDFIDPKKVYTVVDFQRDANKAIELILAKEKQPIIVGGSALYIYALTEGYKFTPATPEEQKRVRQLHRELEKMELGQLIELLKGISPKDFRRVDLKNKRRVVRALEGLLVLRNKKISRRENLPIPYSILKIGIELPREEVYQRIDKRTDEWIAEGLIAESRNLMRIGVNRRRINEFGLGYREVLKYLRGEIKNKDELTEKINFSQHAYVRRQMTWFKRDKKIKWLENIKAAEVIIKKFLST